MIFGNNGKIDNFDPYNALMVIASNIPVPLMTAFCAPGSHIGVMIIKKTAQFTLHFIALCTIHFISLCYI